MDDGVRATWRAHVLSVCVSARIIEKERERCCVYNEEKGKGYQKKKRGEKKNTSKSCFVWNEQEKGEAPENPVSKSILQISNSNKAEMIQWGDVLSA